LLIGRRQARPRRAALIGLAAGIAVGVAASRVLLDVHWLTDVIAGLALGWAWFAVCSIAFGGRILRFGAGAEVAARAAASGTPGRDVDPEERAA
jgi:undecaprenyl-diphosphatase